MPFQLFGAQYLQLTFFDALQKFQRYQSLVQSQNYDFEKNEFSNNNSFYLKRLRSRLQLDCNLDESFLNRIINAVKILNVWKMT